MSDVVQKLWGFCHTLRHDGVDYGDYIEQITYLLFLKMADERGIDLSRCQVVEEDGRERTIACDWPTLCGKSGTDLTDDYAFVLWALGKQSGLLSDIFAGAQSRFNNPVNLKRLIGLIDETEWIALDVDVKAEAFEGLLEKAASEGKKGAGQYFTPRLLIQSIVRCIKPDPRAHTEFAIGDPACGTGGFLVSAYEWLIHPEQTGGALDRDLAKRALDETRLRLCPVGSVLVVIRSGILARTLPIAIADAEVAINQDLKAFYAVEPILNEWLAIVLRAAEHTILEDSRKDGTTVHSIRFPELKAMQLPIPPEAEQRRIIAQVDRALAHINSAREQLNRVPAILKRFRQSVLAAACSGRLTADWREQRVDLEPASCLLERIQKERQAELGTKYREPASPDHNDFFELPEQWQWAPLETLAHVITDGDHNPPKRVAIGVPHLTAKNIKRQQIVFNGCTFISEADFVRTSKRYLPVPGDVIVTCVGTVGQTAIVPNGCVFSADRNLAAIRLVPNGLNAAFLQYVLNLEKWQQLMSGASGSTAQPHLYLGDLKQIPVPLPSLREQDEVIRHVEGLFKLADAIERRVEAGTQRAEKLTQAVLAKAFRGELVPTEAELARQEGRGYEPASALLKRIQAGRATQPTTRNKNRSATGQKRLDL